MNPPIRLYMTMSLDGFIAGPDDRKGQELGRDGGRLFNWLDDRLSDGPSGQVFREAMATGAVISGRRTFELAGRWQGDHHDGVPIFVLTHHIDDGDVPPGSARFVTDVEACAEQARAAAGDRAVMVHGAGAAQALLRAGLLGELEIHVVPVLLGGGRPLFGSLGPGHGGRARCPMGLAGVVCARGLPRVLLGVRSPGQALAQHRNPAQGQHCDLRFQRGARHRTGGVPQRHRRDGDRARPGQRDRGLLPPISGAGPARMGTQQRAGPGASSPLPGRRRRAIGAAARRRGHPDPRRSGISCGACPRTLAGMPGKQAWRSGRPSIRGSGPQGRRTRCPRGRLASPS
jgi:dihydrofolate reductase